MDEELRGNVGFNSQIIKCSTCVEMWYKYYQCPKKENWAKDVMHHMKPKDTMEEGVRGRVYATIDEWEEEYQDSLIWARSIIFSQSYIF